MINKAKPCRVQRIQEKLQNNSRKKTVLFFYRVWGRYPLDSLAIIQALNSAGPRRQIIMVWRLGEDETSIGSIVARNMWTLGSRSGQHNLFTLNFESRSAMKRLGLIRDINAFSMAQDFGQHRWPKNITNSDIKSMIKLVLPLFENPRIFKDLGGTARWSFWTGFSELHCGRPDTAPKLQRFFPQETYLYMRNPKLALDEQKLLTGPRR